MVEHASEQHCADVQAFCDGIQGIIDDSLTQPFFQHFSEYMTRVFHLACTHKVKLESNFITIAIAMKIAEGISIKLNPDVQMVEGLKPWIFKAELHHGGSKIADYLWDRHGLTKAGLSSVRV